ncbi:MAG: DNA-deoxyinosine glycosylase [Planctomycetota bacterium]|nr:DNA-deoxyinosine glycosylase [Planctomycetota bacterium]
MASVSSFPPVASRDARVLVLGSMPGVASLEAQRYYAHPRNAFWPIMGELLGFDASIPYRSRLAALRRSGVALWDVLAQCVRPGSLDSDIDLRSAQPNDFAGFLQRHRGVEQVLCNGGVAFQVFRRRVLPQLPPPFAALSVLQMPSTSPANAGARFEQKLAKWREGLRPLLSGAR